MTDRVGSGHTGGMATALGDAVAAAEPAGDLFGERQAVAVRAAGRPPGARNRRTQEYAALLIARHGDPLAAAVRVASIDLLASPHQLRELADKLGVKLEVALDFYAKTRAAVLPYLHQEQPRAVEINRGAPGNPIEASDLFGLAEVIEGEFEQIAEPPARISGRGGEAVAGDAGGNAQSEQNQWLAGSSDDQL